MLKKIFFLIIISISVVSLYSQEVEYYYDIHGNRTQRKVINITIDTSFNDFIDKPIPINYNLNTASNTKINITNNKDNTKISLYPNPSQNVVNIDIDTKELFSDVQITLFNSRGQLLYKKTSVSLENSIDISKYISGIYNLYVEIGDFKYKQVIIKE